MKRFQKNNINSTQEGEQQEKQGSHTSISNEDEVITLIPEPINPPETSFSLESPAPQIEIEKDWGVAPPPSKRHPRLWLIAALVLTVIIATLWLIQREFDPAPSIQPVQEKQIAKRKLSRKSPQLQEYESKKTIEALKSCIQNYLSANTVAGISAYSRHPKTVQPLMVDYYRRHSRAHLKFKSIEELQATHIQGHSFFLVRSEVIDLNLKNNPKNTSISLILEQTGEFEFKVDWEVDVFYQPMPWSEYTYKRPLQPLAMRVLVTKDSFYAYAFRDSNRFQCYELKVPGEKNTLFAYAKRRSALNAQLNKLLTPPKQSHSSHSSLPPVASQKEEQPVDDLYLLQGDLSAIGPQTQPGERSDTPTRMTRPMILKIHFLREDASKRSVFIDAIVSENWVRGVSSKQLPSKSAEEH